MRNLRECLLLLMAIVLLACNETPTNTSSHFSSKKEVILELSIPINNSIDQFSNSPFFYGIKLVEFSKDKMIVSVDTESIELETAKQNINYQGLVIEKQYVVEPKATVAGHKQEQESASRLQIPEITFPNIFKALVVFYH